MELQRENERLKRRIRRLERDIKILERDIKWQSRLSKESDDWKEKAEALEAENTQLLKELQDVQDKYKELLLKEQVVSLSRARVLTP